MKTIIERLHYRAKRPEVPTCDRQLMLKAEAVIMKLQAELERLRALEKRANDHPLVLAEGGTDGVDRCHRVIDKQAAALVRLRAAIKRWAAPRGTHRGCDCACCERLWEIAQEGGTDE